MLGRIPLIAAAALAFAACRGSDYDVLDRGDEARGESSGASRGSDPRPTATASIAPKSGSSIEGDASLTQQDGKVSMTVRLSNAPPGTHAVHLHEKGDCSAPDASSAGDHWNPDGNPHGKRDGGAFHAGDLDNIEIGPDGTGTLTLEASDLSLDPQSGKNPIGKAVIVHAQADDFVTQPDGAGGTRIGCGVFESGRK